MNEKVLEPPECNHDPLLPEKLHVHKNRTPEEYTSETHNYPRYSLYDTVVLTVTIVGVIDFAHTGNLNLLYLASAMAAGITGVPVAKKIFHLLKMKS